MKQTKYIFSQIITRVTKTIELDSDKFVRFSCGLHVCYMRVNNDGEVIIGFNEDPRTFQYNEERNELFVQTSQKQS